jgi:hypothetical protein
MRVGSRTGTTSTEGGPPPGPLPSGFCPRTFRRDFRIHLVLGPATIVTVAVLWLVEVWIIDSNVGPLSSIPGLINLFLLFFTMASVVGALTFIETFPPPEEVSLGAADLSIARRTLFGTGRTSVPWTGVRLREVCVNGTVVYRLSSFGLRPARAFELDLETELGRALQGGTSGTG